MKKILKKSAFIFFISFLILFMINNRDYIFIKLFPFPFEVESRIFVVVASFFILGYIFAMIIYSKNLLNTNLRSLLAKKTIKKSTKKTIKKKQSYFISLILGEKWQNIFKLFDITICFQIFYSLICATYLITTCY